MGLPDKECLCLRVRSVDWTTFTRTGWPGSTGFTDTERQSVTKDYLGGQNTGGILVDKFQTLIDEVRAPAHPLLQLFQLLLLLQLAKLVLLLLLLSG